MSPSEAPGLERRTTKLQKSVMQRADELRRATYALNFTPPPGPGPQALRLHVFAEIMAAAGFSRDQLYVEYMVAYDPQVWALQSPAGAAAEEPGLVKVGRWQPGECLRDAVLPL